MQAVYTHVAAVPGQPFAIDFVQPGTWRTHIENETIDQVAARHPGAIVMTWESFEAIKRQALQTPPEECTAEHFDYLLNVLPPVAWFTGAGSESFKLCEFTSADITCCAVRIGARYWTLQRPVSTPHYELVRMVRDHLAANPGA